jgi:hypothetical protein
MNDPDYPDYSGMNWTGKFTGPAKFFNSTR